MFPQALVLMLLLGIGACTRSDTTPLPESVARLEYMVLSYPTPWKDQWVFAGRYEVTREEYGASPREVDHDLPITMISFHEAEAWCAERNLRLPSYWEWRHFANSGRANSRVEETARNGLTLGLRRPLPVGVFERGRTADGAYDFFGNVREWAYDSEEERFLACGGSYASREADTIEQIEMLPSEQAEDVGFRYFADAPDYLMLEVVPLWAGLGQEQRALAVGFFSDWRPHMRTALAEALLQRGAPKDFCSALADA
ncbi:MAG: formylglycine-generating enzyme family protein [Planctomycetota bacterium]